ncbi:MAG: hypothetical protein LBE59_02240 [Nevskiaceae bacterium]|jgi:hypothetical protein|nr:hypothetical protein [Nevskiaceae bacterium]
MRRAALAGISAALLVSLACLPAAAQAPGERSAWNVNPATCDYACLTGFANGYMAALAKRDASPLKQAAKVRFTENNVELPFGTAGMWATVTGVAPTGLVAADTQTGQAAWIGTAQENGKPVYFGLRLAVRDGVLIEAETVVVRNVGLPLPFGDASKVEHDPAFNEILPPERRRSRERLRAVADSYFSTVELNDGIVFAPFTEDCGRLENGILTTVSSADREGMAGNVAPGCETQLRLGIYRINKRIRERRYPLIDVERGVVVATGFFDHANAFDRYKLVDGREMTTLLKWPNSISLVEAFKIDDGRIHRIEAVFNYVPYFMHSPFYDAHPAAPAPVPESPLTAREPCDEACLIDLSDRFMDAMVRNRPQDLPWANYVRFTENSVAQQIDEGIWGSIRAKSDTALRVADPRTGTVTWYGLISDHDAWAWFGLRLKVLGRRIADVQVHAARERNPGPFGDPKQFALDPALSAELPAGERSNRRKMLALVAGYQDSMQRNDGRVLARLAPNCVRRENGIAVTAGDVGSAGIVKAPGSFATGCEAQLKLGLYRPVDAIRDRRVLAVDEARGLVVMSSFADYGFASPRYTLTDGRAVETSEVHPMSRELFEIYRIRSGQIASIDAVSVFQPYLMPSPLSD